MTYEYSQRGNTVTAFLQKDGVGSSMVSMFPETSDVCISHGVWIPHVERGKGVGDAQHKLRLEWMKKQGFKLAICTVAADNDAELAILNKNGWLCVSIFKSSYENHMTCLYVKDL